MACVPEAAVTLKANEGKIVCVFWNDGTIELVSVVSVDSEGFVYELSKPEDGETLFWNRFEELTSVQPGDVGF